MTQATNPASPSANPNPSASAEPPTPARALAQSTVLEDNPRVRITEWRFAPGAQTGWHKHALDYVVVYRSAAQHWVESAQGGQAVTLAAGASYFRRAGVEHNVINAGEQDIVLVETELK